HPSQLLTVLGVRLRVDLVAVGLAGLREQDQRRRICRLGREREVEEDERVLVEVNEDRVAVEDDPEDDDERLGRDVLRRPEETCEPLGYLAEPVVAERRAEVPVRHQIANGLLGGLEEAFRSGLQLLDHGARLTSASASASRSESSL